MGRMESWRVPVESARRIGHVLRFSEDLAQAVLDGAVALNDAYEKAREAER
jgi:hypothetical protein